MIKGDEQDNRIRPCGQAPAGLALIKNAPTLRLRLAAPRGGVFVLGAARRQKTACRLGRMPFMVRQYRSGLAIHAAMAQQGIHAGVPRTERAEGFGGRALAAHGQNLLAETRASGSIQR
ncbi:hypothetical protein EV679_1979 [Kerstersia gyiorum]|uniref:Uncharacterized protein n=1 Tax=Kerstersia gyiorum TaxID=206506 RepID=A0A4Q7MUA2_9BURK|nr:hypothetical protein EV679_1979 [Kerstersia gyiorum]